jgi:hypothetical protein
MIARRLFARRSGPATRSATQRSSARQPAFYCYVTAGLSAAAAVVAWFMLPFSILILFTLAVPWFCSFQACVGAPPQKQNP